MNLAMECFEGKIHIDGPTLYSQDTEELNAGI